jgi:N-acetylneuraminic acid mutarotase
MKSIINHRFKRASFAGAAASLANLPARAPLAKLIRPEFGLAVLFGLSISIRDVADAAGTWTNTGSLLVPQDYPTDVLLASGKVLLIDPAGASAEIYDPATGGWTATAGLRVARFTPSTTLLADGRVLVAGGWNSQSEYLTSAEIYNPQTGTWTSTGSMNHRRGHHTGTLLPNGNVLVTGGIDVFASVTATTEVYNPDTGAWTLTGPMSSGRSDYLCTLLADGKVLVAGGFAAHGLYLTNSELYDPNTKNWTNTGPLNVARTANRIGHSTATLLANGQVLAAGGNVYQVNANGTLTSAELFDPASGTWTMTSSLPGPRSDHSATLLLDGKVLVAGGTDGTPNTYLSSALLYDPADGSWTTRTSLLAAHEDQGATLLPNGTVLVMGGNDTTGFPTAIAEVYDPGLGSGGSSQPLINSVSLLNSTNGLTLSGSGFGGISNLVIQLVSLNSGVSVSLPATSWSADSITSASQPVPFGCLMATVFVNGVPSVGRIFNNPPPPGLGSLPNQFSANLLPPSMVPGGGITVNFVGTPAVTYTVQRAPALTGPWAAVGTVTVGQTGMGAYKDPSPTAGQTFYRTAH